MDTLSRQLTPFVLTIVLVLLSLIPYQVPGLSRVMPLFSLIAIYHWGVYRSDLLPLYAVFFIGLFQDALGGMPMGIYTLVFVVAYGVVLAQNRFFLGKSFYVVWLGFALISGVAGFAVWLMVSTINTTLVDPRPAIYQFALGLGFYPLVTHMFLRWQRAILRQI